MTGKYYLVGILLTVAVVVATFAAYPSLPHSVPTHWGIHNQPNGYSPKWALFLLGPGSMAGVMLLMYFLPWLSPKQFEIESFRATCLQIMLMVVTALGYFFVAVLWVDAGHRLNMGRAIGGGVCLLFASLGNVMGKIRKNFYIGIRTPWTLANERVWNATHRFAAKTLVFAGLSGFALAMAGLNGWPMIAILLAGPLVPVFYSLAFYKQLERRGEL